MGRLLIYIKSLLLTLCFVSIYNYALDRTIIKAESPPTVVFVDHPITQSIPVTKPLVYAKLDVERMPNTYELPLTHATNPIPISFVTVPRSFDNPEIASHQLAAIHTWNMQDGGKHNEIMLMTREANNSICHVARTHHYRCMDGVRTQYDIPLLDSVFQLASTHATHSIVCFINSDIGLPPGWYASLLPLLQWVITQERPFLIAGPRLEFQSNTVWIPDQMPWHTFKTQHMNPTLGVHYAPVNDRAIDWFLFYRGTFVDDMPPFLIGRYTWDSWMLHHALRRRWLTIHTLEHPRLFGMHWDHSRAHHDAQRSLRNINTQLAENHGGYHRGRLQNLALSYQACGTPNRNFKYCLKKATIL